MMSTQIQNSRPRNNRRPNHIPNNRPGFSNANSHRRETPEIETPPSPNCKGIYEDPRTAMMMCTVLGAHSTVKTRNGNKYKGHTTGFSDKGDIAMVDAKLEVEDSAGEQHIPGIVIPKDNFVVCITNGVDVKGLSIGSSGFTDAGITSRVNGSSQAGMKELQPWQDEDADTTTSMALDDDQVGGWEPKDMFLENKEKFNIKSSFHDDLRGYTTELPDPTSEGYEERRRFAEKKAEEIERSEIYRSRIAKENEDGDEEAKYSSVHRSDKDSGVNKGPDSHSGPPVKATYTVPQLRGQDADHNMMRNGGQSRQAGRPGPRQNSPNFPHQSMHNSRQHMNSHYNQGPHMPNRNPRQIPPQSPNHGPPPISNPHHPHSIPQSQAPPHSQAPLQQHHNQQQSSRPHPPQQATSQPSKPNLLQHPNVPSLNQHPPHMTAHKITHSQSPMQDSIHSSQQQPPPNRMPHTQQQHMNGGKNGQHISEMGASHKHVDRYGVTPPNQAAAPLVPSSSKAPEPVANNAAPVDHKPVTATTAGQSATSPPTVQGADKRNGRNQDAVPEENRKVKDTKVQQLMDFSHNFVLDNSAKSQESSSESTEDNSKSSAASSGIGGTESSAASSVGDMSSSPSLPAASSNSTSSETSGTTHKATDKSAEADASKSDLPKSTLNPLAAEFKPKVQPTTVEAQPSPPPLRVSPQVLPPAYAASNVTWVPASAISTYPGRTKGVLPVGRDLTAQVTGQPLMAHGQHMIYMPPQGQSYQVYNARIAPNSFTASQAGQQAALDQSSPQPPQVFGPLAPIPAHLPHHPQSVHGQPMPNPSTGQQPQPAHMPNPAPSPVHQHQQQHQHQHQHQHHQHQHQHQQQPQAHGGQPLPHPIPQGPPQSVTPQPAHYPHVSLQPGIQAMPRTSTGQHVAAGPGVHPSVSINYPLQQYSYPNASSAQNTFVHAPQPQMSQSSSHHTPGHQPQYVMMPQPQGHTPMQAIQAQPFFQAQQNILHGPPQMPPTVHSHNPNQGTANFIPSGVQGLPAGMQQVPGALIPNLPSTTKNSNFYKNVGKIRPYYEMQSLPQSYQPQQ